MLVAVIAAIALQQAAGSIAWDSPVLPAETAPEAPAASPPAAALPDWARADPFAWERAQCSPMVRKEDTMEACQVRVRSELALALGDRLPPALAPSGVEACRQVANEAGGFELTCAPVQRSLNATPAPVAEICEDRPVRNANGAVTFGRECRPASGPADRSGVGFTIKRD